jgi:hypothetical protein
MYAIWLHLGIAQSECGVFENWIMLVFLCLTFLCGIEIDWGLEIQFSSNWIWAFKQIDMRKFCLWWFFEWFSGGFFKSFF